MDIDIINKRIEELLEDKHETVTYIMLSEEFKITTVQAREIMENYVEKRREHDPDSIGLLYVVYGITKAEGRNFVAVMTPSAMEEQKEKLIDCHHILLSIYKTANKDSNIQPDPFGIFRLTKAPLSGCIVSRNAVKRKLKVHPATIQPSTKQNVDTKTAGPKIESSINTGSKKQNGLGNFLSKASSASEIQKKTTPKPKGKNMMSAFLSKAPSKSADDIKPKSRGDNTDKRETSPIAEEIEEIVDVEMKTEKREEPETGKKHKLIDTDDSDDDVPSIKKLHVKDEQPSQKKKRPRNEKKKNEQRSKKRRRIINDAENSDSDDIFGSDQQENEEDVIDGSDTDEVKVPTVADLKNSRKVRKKVSDMFLEEEGGYFQTVNKWEYESASDKEEEKEQKPNNSIQSKKAEDAFEKKPAPANQKLGVSPPKPIKNAKGKKAVPQNQTSIMNFFKKK